MLSKLLHAFWLLASACLTLFLGFLELLGDVMDEADDIHADPTFSVGINSAGEPEVGYRTETDHIGMESGDRLV